MQDQSYLDKKYFIDTYVYNCPFCNRRNVSYRIIYLFKFDWTNNKECFEYIVQCTSCGKISIHLSFEQIPTLTYRGEIEWYRFNSDVNDIDGKIFYSVPTSFFVMDERIPKIIRELITESEGCLKINFLTGASACMRKAIYELLVIEKAEGTDYESKIKSLKKKHTESDPALFDILSHIQDMTSDKIHEQSWDKWNSKYLKLIIETLKTILHDIYVLPKVKSERSQYIQQLRESLIKDKRGIKNCKTGNAKT